MPQQPPPDDEDPAANTQMFRAFVDQPEAEERPRVVGAPFRIVTLLVGLFAFALVVFLLLRL